MKRNVPKVFQKRSPGESGSSEEREKWKKIVASLPKSGSSGEKATFSALTQQLEAGNSSSSPKPSSSLLQPSSVNDASMEIIELRRLQRLIVDRFEEFVSCDVLCSHPNCAQSFLQVSLSTHDLWPPETDFPVKSRRILLSSEGILTVDFLGHSKTFMLANEHWENKLLEAIEAYLAPGNAICRGVTEAQMAQLCGNVQTTMALDSGPLRCHRSTECQFVIKQVQLQGRPNETGRCNACSRAWYGIERTTKRRVETAKGDKQSTSTSTNFRYLTMGAKKRRLQNLKTKVHRQEKAINKVQEQNEKLLISLSANQSKELNDISKKIANDHSEDLEDVFISHGRQFGTEFEQFLRNAWEGDQTRNRAGNTGNRWSTVTFRLALAVFARSKSAYKALSEFPMLQLPSIRQLQRMVSSNYTSDQGTNQKQLLSESERYDSAQNGKSKPGKKTGALIFDEVHIVSKTCWNSKNHEIYGVSATLSDLGSLADVYRDYTDEIGNPAEYALQFLWRDLTSNYDVLGPYYLSAKTVDTTFLWACLSETLRAFAAATFRIICLICDGASSNLALLKMLLARTRGAFGVGRNNPDSKDDFSVPCSFQNPFDLEQPIYVIPCPSHALKNFINTLQNSRKEGSRGLTMSRRHQMFGWKIIWDAWEREKHRRKTRSQRVLRLIEAYVIRDSWTKLNVFPAKIFQQDEFIAELQEHLATNPPNAQEVDDTIQYLACCRSLFEHGFLSHARVYDFNSDSVVSIKKGMQFLQRWYQKLSADYADFNSTDPREKRFLAFQTFDLIRLSHYGFLSLVNDFHRQFPAGYYLLPFRINGSAVESVFGQLRQRVGGGALTGINYSSALAKLKVSHDCEFHSGAVAVQGAQYGKDNLYLTYLKAKRDK